MGTRIKTWRIISPGSILPSRATAPPFMMLPTQMPPSPPCTKLDEIFHMEPITNHNYNYDIIIIIYFFFFFLLFNVYFVKQVGLLPTYLYNKLNCPIQLKYLTVVTWFDWPTIDMPRKLTVSMFSVTVMIFRLK